MGMITSIMAVSSDSFVLTTFIVCFTTSFLGCESTDYVVDDTTLGRQFDGIGAISGGGATSRLLVNYKEPYRSQILDYLFKPNFGASLHILKVEIGGDGQSSDGTEPSHMHTADEENYQRGYEWWLMKEAKKRNPGIKLIGLPWSFPGWLGDDDLLFPYPYHDQQKLADYIVKWVQGAAKHHNLTIDYVGIWNERPYDIKYIELLRTSLDKSSLQHVKIIAADGQWAISYDILADKNLADSVDIIGVHYPGTISETVALNTGKTLWSSEDYSTFNDNVGGGCWARILNQNYVNGNMTSTIAWNLLASYYAALQYDRDGLMTAKEPWSGHYQVASPIWIAAHTTQFSQPGWHYLRHGAGSGKLAAGGSYVTLVGGDQLTVVVETMTRDHSVCIRPDLPPYQVSPQEATFILKGAFANLTSLYVWHSKLGYDGNKTVLFENLDSLKVQNGKVTLSLEVDAVYTLTTLSTGNKGQYPSPPNSAPFPFPYKDNFDNYSEYSEADNFADQSGVFEIRSTNDSSHGKAMKQVVGQRPVVWCLDSNNPISVIGDYSWGNYTVTADVYIEAEGSAMLGARVTNGSCQVLQTRGIFLWLNANGSYDLSYDIILFDRIKSGTIDVKKGGWYTASLQVKENQASATLDGKTIFKDVAISKSPQNGFAAIGTGGYNSVWFDNFSIN